MAYAERRPFCYEILNENRECIYDCKSYVKIPYTEEDKMDDQNLPFKKPLTKQ